MNINNLRQHVIDREGLVWRVVRDGGMATRADYTGITSIGIHALRESRGPLTDLADLLAAVEALERLTDSAEPITKDDSPDHVFVPSDREWQEFELAQTYARAVLRRLWGEEGDR